ncbi:MAG: lipopolysaccharide biosynthesis protein [Caldimonas sp.]
MRAEIARGAAWMVLFRLFDRSVGIVSTALLARLLIPADFGLVAMAMSVIAIIDLATTFSFEIALIQKPDPKREHFDTAWTLNILIAIAGALVTAALAVPAASFYGDPRLVPVMFAICGAWLISGFENTGTANFRRDMNFSAEFRWMASKRLISFIVTLVAAFVLRSYWALVIGMAMGRASGVVISYIVHPFRPRFALTCARELFSFSGWLLVNNIAGVVFSRLPHIYVGRMFGAQTLGAYAVGSEIAQLAQTELVAPINRAMFPGYARMADDPPTFRRLWMDATAAILLIALPVSAAVAVLARPMVRVLLGEQWQQAVPIIHILAFSGAITALSSNNVSAYLALGKPYLSTLIHATRVLIFVAIILLLVPGHGVVSVAYAEVAAAFCSLLAGFPILLWSLQLNARDYLASLWRPLLASALGAGAVSAAVNAVGNPDSFSGAVMQLLVGLLVGAATYPALLWLLWIASGRPQAMETEIARRIGSSLSGLLRRAA